jgi:hypothetical protein
VSDLVAGQRDHDGEGWGIRSLTLIKVVCALGVG